MALTCSSSDRTSDCPTPTAGSRPAELLVQARAAAGFAVLYPCDLPAGQTLASMAVTGQPGRQQSELVFSGPFDLSLRQAQYPPAVSPDPSGASRIEIDLFSNVRAILIERNDGTRHALYHLFWDREGIFYEVQAAGPPLQRAYILRIARSLQ